jgi:hypothetical protein
MSIRFEVKMDRRAASDLVELLCKEGREASVVESGDGRYSVDVSGCGVFQSIGDWIMYVERQEHEMRIS